VIGVLNVHHKEPHPHTPEEIGLLTFLGEQMGGAIVRSRLAQENVRLQQETEEMKRRLEDRTLVERAKGILQQRYRLSEQDAYLRLRNESRGCAARCANWPRPFSWPRGWTRSRPPKSGRSRPRAGPYFAAAGATT